MFSPDHIPDFVQEFGIAGGNANGYGGGHGRYPPSLGPESKRITRPNHSPFANKKPNNSADFSLDERAFAVSQLTRSIQDRLFVGIHRYGPDFGHR